MTGENFAPVIIGTYLRPLASTARSPNLMILWLGYIGVRRKLAHDSTLNNNEICGTALQAIGPAYLRK